MPKPVVLADKECPLCGGNEFWDNRTSKKNPKAPDYKCANKDCRDEKGYAGAIWLDKPKEVKKEKVPAEIKKNKADDDVYSILLTIDNKLTAIHALLTKKPAEVIGSDEINEQLDEMDDLT